ncbi:MAG: hypothetical protein HQK60_12000, partial [Deltaproteobacteria bacterium]|nr:hypothetical protein [Deltaproteobacteria bacterium]
MTDIFEVVKKVKNLPPFPKTVQRALDMLKKPDVSNQQLIIMFSAFSKSQVGNKCFFQ